MVRLLHVCRLFYKHGQIIFIDLFLFVIVIIPDKAADMEQADHALYRRFQETHYQRGYELEQMKDCLRRAGMVFVEAVDADTHEAVNDVSERIYVVARKGA